MAWTDDRVETLKTMWGEGMSASQIAKELGGVTRNAVIGKVHRLGLSSRNQGKPDAPEAKAAEPVAAPVEVVKPKAEKVAPEAVQPVVVEAVETKPEAAEDDSTLPAEVEAPGGMVTIPSENQVNIAEIDRDAHKLSLMELTERTCKWPIGDPSRGEFYFCGHPVVAGKPYCKGHAAAAYQPMSSRRDRDRARNTQRPAITRSA
jgi:GcrA cell cycle regulator